MIFSQSLSVKNTFAISTVALHSSCVRCSGKHLNLKQLEFTKTTPQQERRPAYPPETLLKLWIYGHHNKIRSADN